MHINDLNGQRIEVTDLDAAIEQASMFTHMKHADSGFSKLDDELNLY